VNGDKFADMVFTSQLDSHFVVIFLNDGHAISLPPMPVISRRRIADGLPLVLLVKFSQKSLLQVQSLPHGNLREVNSPQLG